MHLKMVNEWMFGTFAGEYLSLTFNSSLSSDEMPLSVWNNDIIQGVIQPSFSSPSL